MTFFILVNLVMWTIRNKAKNINVQHKQTQNESWMQVSKGKCLTLTIIGQILFFIVMHNFQ